MIITFGRNGCLEDVFESVQVLILIYISQDFVALEGE